MLQQKINLSSLPPLSLYIHLPWCIKKCPYCDFNSHVFRGENLPQDAYIDALILDIESAIPLIWDRPVYSIFIGGGTPSLFSGKNIERLLNAIRSRINLSPFAEITLEANPSSVEVQYLHEYALAGVNRLSLGVQSFNDQHLSGLGRVHNKDDAIWALHVAKKLFKNINIDLMYGLANQTIQDVLSDISIALKLEPQHISYYNLTIEPNTHFYKFIPANMPNNDLCYEMQELIETVLKNNNYIRYEVSAYSLDKFQSKHNLNYWMFGDYLGIGAGAHSKLSNKNTIIRQVRQKHPKEYMQSVATNTHIIENNIVSFCDLSFEFAMNAFRLLQGFDLALFTKHTGVALSEILPILNIACERKMIQLNENTVKPTKLGIDFLNELILLFMKDSDEQKISY